MFNVSRLLRSRAPNVVSKLTQTRAILSPIAARALPSAAATDDHSWIRYGLGAIMVFAGVGVIEADNCGIVGVVSKHQEANTFLLEGLTILQNRGYDSAGMATTKHDGASNIEVTKYASVSGTADSINLLRESKDKHNGNTVGIAHTRWATHGTICIITNMMLFSLLLRWKNRRKFASPHGPSEPCRRRSQRHYYKLQ
jgi:hypothetical protein